MKTVNPVDQGRTIDWGKTSADYAAHRPGPPDSFYQKLQALGVGLPDQRILDVGTGTGVIARKLASQRCEVAGVDISDNQIETAKNMAVHENLRIDFRVGAAEAIPFENNSFDIVTANQCWLYFDKHKALAEVKRILRVEGLLVLSHFSWLPRVDRIANASEQLVLKHNPQWSANDWSGVIPTSPEWADGQLILRGLFFYDVDIPFTRDSWRGRFRACRGIGAGLAPAEVAAFDREHDALLAEIAGDNFTVTHRIDAHIFSFKGYEDKHV